MNPIRLTLLNLDESVSRQEWFGSAAVQGAQIIDLRDIAPKLRLAANRRAFRIFSERIAKIEDRPEIFFLGSGDFHHLTYALLQSVTAPCTVIHFDNHPDWVRLPPMLTCATWVNWALDLPQIARVITLGPCSDDLQFPELKFAHLDAIRSGRLEIYPWRQSPSRIWGRSIDSPCVRTTRGRLIWRNLAEEPWDRFVSQLCARIPTKNVWITIDKDVLRPHEAVTNWDQGDMTVDQMLAGIARIAEQHRLIAVDVCGDYSPAHFHDPLRAGISFFDRPFAKPPRTDPAAVNGQTNARIVAGLAEIAARFPH